MKQHDDYVAGPHHFWTHFWCGLVFGGLIGAWISRAYIESTGGILVFSFLAGLVFAYFSGRWGDRAWHWLLERLRWIT